MKFIQFFVISAVFIISSCGEKIVNQTPIIVQEVPGQSQLDNRQSAFQEKRYVSGTDDVPLFEGLEFDEENSSNFDTMTGNIVISNYLYPNNSQNNPLAKSIQNFYQNALPQLGWTLSKSVDNKILFIRDNDKLEISIKSVDKTLSVRFFIIQS